MLRKSMDAEYGTNASQSRRRWVMLVVAFMFMLTYGSTLQAVAPVLSLIMHDFYLSHAQGGLLTSLYAVPGLIISIPAGMLSDRYGQRVIALVSFSLTIAGIAIVATGTCLPILIWGRLMTGAGAMTLMVLGPQLLAQWFRGREVGTAMAVFNAGFIIGSILSLYLLAMAGERLGWRASIWLSAGIPLLGLVIFALLFTPALGRGQETSGGGETGRPESLLQGLRLVGVPIWIVGAAWMLFNCCMIALFTFTPDFLQTTGISVTSAGFVTSAVMWTGLVVTPLVGYMIDKLGHKPAIIAISSVALAVLVLLVPSITSWVLVIMLLIGIAQTMVPAAIFALPPDVTSPKRLGLSFGILNFFLSLGIVVGPAAAGFVRDVTGSYPASYVLMAVFSLLVALSMLVLGRTRGQMGTATHSD